MTGTSCRKVSPFGAGSHEPGKQGQISETKKES